MNNPETMATLGTQDTGRTVYWHIQLFNFCDHTCPFYDSTKQKRTFEYHNDTTFVM